MSSIKIEAQQIIHAPAEEVYALLADYRVGHPSILPKPFFVSMSVDEGGQGAGTVGRLRMKTLGQERESRMLVTEPEPGHILLESYPEAGITTMFTIDPLRGPSPQTNLIFTTQMETSRGIKGLFERCFAPMILRRVYRQEFGLIEQYFNPPSS